MNLLCNSERVLIDLNTWIIGYNDDNIFDMKLIIREWKDIIIGSEYRAFVGHDGNLNALCQYYNFLFFPFVVQHKNIILEKIRIFYEDELRQKFIENKQLLPCVIDFVLLCQFATPITGCAFKLFQNVCKDTLETMHTYGHGLIAGMFIYVLLIDILPMIEEGHLESHQHHPRLAPKKDHSPIPNDRKLSESSEVSEVAKHSKTISPKILLPILFTICFAITGALIGSKAQIEKVLARWFQGK